MSTHSLTVAAALEILAYHAAEADERAAWPEESWSALVRSGVLRWSVPSEYGGDGRSALEALQGYPTLAAACLTTCFLLSQRDAAVRRLRDSPNESLRRKLLPPLANGECFATVGLSQLTTSRQHTKPALMAQLVGDRVVLDGVMPWVTGAARADYFVTGAALDDGRQILVVVPRDSVGLIVEKPLELAALNGSLTAEVRCKSAEVDSSWLLCPPAEQVMTSGRGGTGGLETSALAAGLARAATDYLLREAKLRPEWVDTAAACDRSTNALWDSIVSLAQSGGSPQAAADVRAQANTLVLRAAQLALAAAKGAGFLKNHPAQRYARQALFFLVWSCPRPALEGTLANLQPVCDE
jgi:alkylation response protein AidB-like acyl-CoA dehydrogenase